MSDGFKIDIGCGGAKREGYLGLDYVPQSGVDHVLDLTADPFPFPNASVSNVYSAHFFEHVGVPNHVLSEIGRVCMEGANIQIITPYAFSDDAFVYGHAVYLTELPWMQFCISHRDAHLNMLGGRWLLNAVNYVVAAPKEQEILAQGFTMDFAVKYFKGVVHEFIVEMQFYRNLDVPVRLPARSYSTERFGERIPLI